MNEAPERIFIDPRVARTMPQEIHETDGISIAYVRQDIAEKAAQTAMDAVMPAEFIVQTSVGPDGTIIALSNMGTLSMLIWANSNEDELRWTNIETPYDDDQSSE